jgi:hypothetical protein
VAFGHLFKANVNQILYEDGFLFRIDYLPLPKTPCAVSQSKHKVLLPIESKSIEILQLIHTDVCGPVLNESYGGFTNFWTASDDFCHFS